MQYVAWQELTRLGLRPYLPQARRRWRPTHSTAVLLRKYPLFPRYVLLSYREAKLPAVRMSRGVSRLKSILCSAEGHLWPASSAVIEAVRASEDRGDFDEILHKGDPILLTKGVLAGVQPVINETTRKGRAEVLLPLFGGVKVVVERRVIGPGAVAVVVERALACGDR
jgi:hypothetical protein